MRAKLLREIELSIETQPRTDIDAQSAVVPNRDMADPRRAKLLNAMELPSCVTWITESAAPSRQKLLSDTEPRAARRENGRGSPRTRGTLLHCSFWGCPESLWTLLHCSVLGFTENLGTLSHCSLVGSPKTWGTLMHSSFLGFTENLGTLLHCSFFGFTENRAR